MFFFPPYTSLCSYRASLLCPPSEPSGPECSRTTNPNSGYKLQTCLWPGSACSPSGELLQQTTLSPGQLLSEQRAARPQLHPAQLALWMTSVVLWYSYTTTVCSITSGQYSFHAPSPGLPFMILCRLTKKKYLRPIIQPCQRKSASEAKKLYSQINWVLG